MESPPSSRLDALDPFEQRVLDVLEGRATPAWDDLLADLARFEKQEAAGGKHEAAEGKTEREHPERPLYSTPPPIDPSEGRRSTSELRRLVAALRGTQPPEPPGERTRAGYALSAPPQGDPRVTPAFVAALGMQAGLRNAFPDLWAVDATLWDRLGTSVDVPALARLWLESPGRRLVQDLPALRHIPRPLGATDFSCERIAQAAGAWSQPLADLPDWPAWRELHLVIPGDALTAWQPHADGEPVVRALRLLEEGSPFFLRGAALAWLLNRAADDPSYAVQGVRCDLRDDLPVRLGAALTTWFADDRDTAVARELETLALQHAAHIFAGDASDGATRTAWSVARWLQRCLTLSPFFGGDEEALVAYLRSLLPREPVTAPPGADALHPGRFRLDESGLNVADVAFMAGVLAHYGREPSRTLLPTPMPLVNALQKIAQREVRPAEEEAEAAGHAALGWPDGYPIAAPRAARKLMTELRIGWVADVGEDAQIYAVEDFARDPKGQAGVAFAFHREAQHLRGKARARAAEVFHDLRRSGAADPHVLATFGVSVLRELGEAGADEILDLAGKGDPTWHPFVADALAGAAERLGQRAGWDSWQATWEKAMERLLRLMEDKHDVLDDSVRAKLRLNAALFALRRASTPKVPGREAFLARIAALASEPPFSEHLGLRREVRRLGLGAPAAAAGGKR